MGKKLIYLTILSVVIIGIAAVTIAKHLAQPPTEYAAFKKLCKSTSGVFYDDCASKFSFLCGGAKRIDGMEIVCDCPDGYFWGETAGCIKESVRPSFSNNLTSADCDIWHDVIEKAFENDNYCATDADCKVIGPIGRPIDFGCYKYINDSVSEDTVYKQLESYAKTCRTGIDKCGRTPKPRCMRNRCVSGDTIEAFRDPVWSEIEKLGISVTGKPTETWVELPLGMSGTAQEVGPRWGPVQSACEQGGYDLSGYGGRKLLLTTYPIDEMYADKELLDIQIMSDFQVIACVYKSVRVSSGMAPGIFPIK